MTIFTFGDSHCKWGWHGINNVETNWLGPRLAYTLGKRGINLVNISTRPIENNDVVVFSFGEIDCRTHIYNHQPYKETIDKIILGYENAVKENLSTLNNNIRMCVLNILPPARKTDRSYNPEYPINGTDEERKAYTLYFNQQLKKMCQYNNWVFIDVYDKYADDEGMLSDELSDKIVHIEDNRYLIEFLREHGLTQ